MRSLLLACLLAGPVGADDLLVATGKRSGQALEVKVSWSGSWRRERDRDGAWIFTKLLGPKGWATGRVRAVQVLEGPLEASPSRDGCGVFVSRSSDGSGEVSGRLQLDVEALGDAGRSRVFAMEMVRIEPLGGGPLPGVLVQADFPPCWLAKHQVKQGLYASFLDTLQAQATFRRAPLGGRTYGGPTGSLRREGDGYVAGEPAAAAGFLSWEDSCAFADWAGLRPPQVNELLRVTHTGGLLEPALQGPRLTLTHGDGRLTRDGRATNTDWSDVGRDVVLLGAAEEPPDYPVSDRRAEVGFRPARTAPGARSVLVLGTDALASLPAGLADLARASGVPRPARVTLRASAGDRFERMASSASLLEELASGRYEVVVLQEDLTVLGGARRSPEHARPLVRAARAGGATPILVMTWGLRDRPSVAFETAAANVGAWASELGVPVAPFGLAWRRALAHDANLRLHDEAGRNPATAGAWLNACVLHQLLYGQLPEIGDSALAGVAAQVVREYVQPR
jgi:hypothetical protein